MGRIHTYCLSDSSLVCEVVLCEHTLTIKVYSYSTKGGKQWGYQIEILTESGDKIYLKNGFFKGRCHEDTIDKMLEIKSLFSPESIKFENQDNLHKVIKDLKLTNIEEQKLKELFSPL